MLLKRSVTAVLLALFAHSSAGAHVQIFLPEIFPSPAGPGALVQLDIRFVAHAMDNGPILPMQAPESVGVMVNGQKIPLNESLRRIDPEGPTRYQAEHNIEQPSAHVFFLQPAPYWDAKEGVMITHYSKVTINSCAAKLPTESSLGWENWEGWDVRVGFPVEIEPLVQPTALWTGSLFRGIVLYDGEPAPFARVEVEYYDRKKKVKLPSNAFKTQILKTDASGVFSFVPVREGWWALSAIRQSDSTIEAPDGQQVPHEQGGVFWIEVTDMP